MKRQMLRSCLPLIVATWLLPCLAFCDSIALQATGDNSIVMVDGEWSINAGGASRLRIKGNQHIVAMNFAPAPLAGKRVAKATLVCHADAEVLSGVTISTIASPWSEMESTGLTAGRAGIEGWGYDGGRFPAVAGGNAFTLAAQATSPLIDGV
jgi:hypothetical protein